MKKIIFFFLNLLILVQSQFNYPWYKNLICAGGWYNLDELIAYPDIIPIESDYSPIRFFIDYKNFDSQCGEGKTYEDICAYKEMIKDQLGKATKLMERIIKVRRFTQDLYFSENLLKNQLQIFIYDSKLSNGISCDYIIILNINQGTQIMNRVFGFAGNPRIFETSTLRPILGIIDIFNNDYRHMENKEYFLLHSFLHQIIHLLVFIQNYFFNSPQKPHILMLLIILAIENLDILILQMLLNLARDILMKIIFLEYPWIIELIKKLECFTGIKDLC